MGLLQGPRGMYFRMSEVPLYGSFKTPRWGKEPARQRRTARERSPVLGEIRRTGTGGRSSVGAEELIGGGVSLFGLRSSSVAGCIASYSQYRIDSIL